MITNMKDHITVIKLMKNLYDFKNNIKEKSSAYNFKRIT